ncbi:MAG: hypothetical protein K2Y27_35200 [Xanthobacteraceae bacterium]|nr:hypothetical protein [Xanthobacteraceae bacterium]
MNVNNAVPPIRRIKTAIAKHRDVGEAASKFGVSYPVLWAELFKHGIRLPYRRDMRRAGFVEAIRRCPNSRYKQADFVGLLPRQFRVSARRYGLIGEDGLPSDDMMKGAS